MKMDMWDVAEMIFLINKAMMIDKQIWKKTRMKRKLKKEWKEKLKNKNRKSKQKARMERET